MRCGDVTRFRDKRRKGASRLEEEFLPAVESAGFRIKQNKEKKEKREKKGKKTERKRGGWEEDGEREDSVKAPRNWQSNKRS